MPTTIRKPNGLVILALLILLSPASAVAQGHQGLVSISAASTLSGAEVREWDSLVDRIIRENDLVLRAAHDDRSVPDRRHERLSQYYRGVPVYGGDVSRQTARGVTVSMFGTVYTQIDLDPTAGLSGDEATTILENVSGTTFVRNSFPSVTILPTLDGRYALTYRATMRNTRTYFVDAHTGQVLLEVDERDDRQRRGHWSRVRSAMRRKLARTGSPGRFGPRISSVRQRFVLSTLRGAKPPWTAC